MENYENGLERQGAQQNKYIGEVAGYATFDAFMNKVYALMGGGLFLSFLTALGVAYYFPKVAISTNVMLIAALVELFLVISISRSIADPAKAQGATAKFFLYSVVTGITFSIIFLAYAPEAIMSALLTTAGVFASMSLVGTVTKKNLQGASRYLFMAIIGILIASLINFFLWNSTLNLAISVVTVIIFTILVAVDTQKLQMIYNQMPAEAHESMAVYGALNLYLDFINIFLSILRIFGAFSDNN